jgi:acetyl-CoA acyltransferase
MGKTAENLHDEYPEITKEMSDEYAYWSQKKAAKAYEEGKIQKTIVPMTVYTKEGWVVADYDQQLRPDTTLEGLKNLRTPFRNLGKVTPGNSSGLNDGAAGVLLMSAEKAAELGIQPKMRLVAYAYAGVRPEVMGLGPVPATKKVLQRAGLTIDDIDIIELNEAFAVQCIVFMKEFGFKLPNDERINPWGGAIALGHPLASSGPRLMIHLMQLFEENPSARYGLATMCVGLGQGGAVIWENLMRK